MNTLLRVLDVEAGYGKITILRNISLEINNGEIVCIIGLNGAGKSTLLKTIYGFVTPRSGTIRLLDRDITGLAPEKMLEQGVAFVPQGRTTFPDMTVEDNLELGMYIVNDRPRMQAAIQRVFDLFPRLRERRQQKMRTMSSGEQRMVEIGRAIMLQPRLLLLDEPSAGLAPVFNKQIFGAIRILNRDHGITVLMIEQNARQALDISHRGYVLADGYNRFEGNSKALLTNLEIQRIYLGGRT
jgi:branched-chain amino acid transport system ATP-binding protein